MTDNNSAFDSKEYDRKIMQTVPYYEEFYKQVIDLVKVHKSEDVFWLDIGCGTGKMAEVAFILDLRIFCPIRREERVSD